MQFRTAIFKQVLNYNRQKDLEGQKWEEGNKYPLEDN